MINNINISGDYSISRKVVTISELRETLDLINLCPKYKHQENSQAWSYYKKAYLIDTIINQLLIPDFYFHVNRYRTSDKLFDNRKYNFAVIDGTQRLIAIKDFFDNKLELLQDIVYYKNKNMLIGGYNFKKLLSSNYYEIISNILNYKTSIIYIFTDEKSLLDEIYLRVNQ